MNIFRRLNKQLSDVIEIRSNRRKDKIVYAEINSENKDRSSILCIFAHYCADNKIKDYVVELVHKIKDSGCDVIFVSSCGNQLPRRELYKLRGLTIANIIRNNVGYDFGSWKTGLDYIPGISDRYSALVFANDSVYGPLYSIAPLLREWIENGPDFMSMTESHQKKYHLQSYFWGLKRKAIDSGFYQDFWYHYYGHLSKRKAVIRRYELTLAQRAKERFDLTVGALFPLERIQDTAPEGLLEKMNPVQHGALKLVKEEKFPFVKRELLDRNPLQLSLVNDLKEYLEGQHPQVWSLIQDATCSQTQAATQNPSANNTGDSDMTQ